jgi:AraC-like DNA-binding protein
VLRQNESVLSAENLLSEIRRHALDAARLGSVVSVGPLLLSRVETSEPDYQISDPLFILMAQGGKRLYLGERRIEYSAGQCLLVTTALPLSGHFLEPSPRHPALAVSLRLRSDLITDLLPELRRYQHVPATVDETIGTLTAPPALLDPIARLLRLRDDPVDMTVLAAPIEREITWRLLTGPLGVSIAQLGLPHSGHAQVTKAITWLRDNLAEPTSISALAGIAGMSTATFHRHFRRTTGMAPQQFHQHLRLQQARSLLLTQAETVTAVAHSVGYSSPTQFSREYHRLFGLPPGRDTAQTRQASTSRS